MFTLLVFLFRSSVRKDLMAAGTVCVCQCVQHEVHAFCVHIFLMQRRTGFVCGVFIPWSRGNVMRVGLLGSKVIKGVLLDETLR